MKKKPGFVLQSVEGENVLVNETIDSVKFDRIVALNATASYLWKEVGDGDFSVDDLVCLLTKEYEVDADKAKADAEELVDDWIKAGLLSF